ncbi:1-phosphatidylinositol 45-bisphosphate phosphodiesterase beta-1 [Dissostichus eleginoides]|uniref:1-phosphatidylinositol 45-bisphosphate phosphodiesterase beta-1 n=1 Tax=Dissostichus eleginoides TaxID=100907 RepID=A0AAD9EU41_DISEL|nr:1-phosphatidylinositol 45-bisphosphate phosphodiesterase beta-1 [Dissostichus eleginoides]
MPRSLTLSYTSLVPEESFPPPAATKGPADTRSTAADHLQPQTNSQAPQPVSSDPSRAPKWLKLPGGFDEGYYGACWKHLLLQRSTGGPYWWRHEREQAGNTLAPSCGITVLEVHQLYWKRDGD